MDETRRGKRDRSVVLTALNPWVYYCPPVVQFFLWGQPSELTLQTKISAHNSPSGDQIALPCPSLFPDSKSLVLPCLILFKYRLSGTSSKPSTCGSSRCTGALEVIPSRGAIPTASFRWRGQRASRIVSYFFRRALVSESATLYATRVSPA